MTVGVPRWPFSVDPLIPEARRRARRRRVLLGVGVATAAAVAVTLSQQPNGAPPSSVSAASASAGKEPYRTENQARLEKGGPVKLLPGPVSTNALGMPVSFEVFHHWFGEQRPGVLFLGRYLSSGGHEVSVESGGVEVDALDSPLAQTVRRLETAPGFRVYDVSAIRLGGYSGRRYSFSVNHLLPLGQGFNLGTGEHDVILLGLGHRTLVIRKMDLLPGEERQARREAERVIQSFQFPS